MKKVINFLLIIIIICGISQICYKYYNYYKDANLNSEIQVLKPIVNQNEKVKVSSAIENTINTNEEELKEINSDYKMWIQIDNTNVDYPVVQYNDNDYYLKHSFTKEASSSGAIFIDYKNNLEEDKNIVIYGHHMKNKTMFSEITKYKDSDFFNENNKINIIRNNENHVYEVFSVYVESADDIKAELTLSDDDEFLKYIKDRMAKSMYKKNIEINEDDNIITLITCSYEFKEARTIVMAVKIN